VHAKIFSVEKFSNLRAIIFCEKHGPNEHGFCHTVTGGPPWMRKKWQNTWYLLEEAKKRGISQLSVSGDGGNENRKRSHLREGLHVPYPNGVDQMSFAAVVAALLLLLRPDIFVAASHF